MTGTIRLNDQIPTDPIAMFAVLLASILLAKTITAEEANTFQTLLPALFSALPYLRR